MAMAIDTKAAVALGAAGAAAACFLCGRASPAVPMKADRLDQQQQQPPDEEPHPLGFTQHKEHPDSAFHKVLDLWGSNEERPSGTLSVQEKHDILTGMRARSHHITMHGEFAHSVLSRVANLGKGISHTAHPMLLAQHQWLEATDERHRYGAMLFEYYALWAASDTMDSFFYWLDSGDGLKVESAGKGSKVITRAMLDAATVKYCTATERTQYVAEVNGDGLLVWPNQGGRPCHTQKPASAAAGGKPIMLIYVMAPDATLYIGDKQREGEEGKQPFHHSSFLSGSTTIAAGSMLVEQGMLKEITPHSGHYRPSEEDFARCLELLTKRGVDMASVQTAKLKVRKEKDLSKLVEQGKAVAAKQHNDSPK